MFQYLKSVFLLGRNDCFSGVGGINFIYLPIGHIITVSFTNKEATIELLVEMNTNTLFSFDN